ncbi:hypothetical protein [Mycobacterium sp. EPa45]|uniref:hypothetical protein n=1 Tax=Mycobacterium sp. EPa45 TaxID=1545728 RepID=UPI0006426623|nr:hypothetical protein [Mycobacterium sp. EPa45]AKK25715.1 hypothetical protein AB431_02210 [Mycobacterium sp. EPa45]
MFGHGTVDGEATIVDRRGKVTTGDGMVTIYEYVADVHVPGEQPYRCIMQEPHIATDFWAPDIGSVVRVHANPERRTAAFDKNDPQVDARQRRAADRDRFDQSAGNPPD